VKDVEVFLKNTWGDRNERKETRSGSGSTMANTQNVRRELPLLIDRWGINSIFDAPCGDGNWMRNTVLNCSYVGGDLVNSFVLSAAGKGLNVYDFDIREHPFPPVDLWLCRACWYHLPHADILAAVDNFKNSTIKYALVTSHVADGEMHDVIPGGFRRLQLDQHEYFGLGEPIDRFIDVEHGPMYNNMVEEMLLFRNPNVK